MSGKSQPLYLCAGTQSSGSTLLAWCFLQRGDMDGVLDARNDLLPDLPLVSSPNLYCKITISCFRMSEMIDHYREEGWEVRPMLVVRDVRAVFNSIVGKTYGSNGTTAEEPPLRMRLRRFKEDWERYRDLCPMVCFEKMLASPEPYLRECCEQLALPWDPAMLEWPKAKGQIADPRHGSPTFRKSLRRTFEDTVDASVARLKVDRIGPDDLDWLEREFAEFNQMHGYVDHADRGDDASATPRAIPSWENTKRFRREQRPLSKVVAACAGLKKMLAG